MNRNFHTKYNHRKKFRDYEKRVSHYVKSALFFDNENELYENIRHSFEMKEKKRFKYDRDTKSTSNKNTNN